LIFNFCVESVAALEPVSIVILQIDCAAHLVIYEKFFFARCTLYFAQNIFHSLILQLALKFLVGIIIPSLDLKHVLTFFLSLLEGSIVAYLFECLVAVYTL